MFGILDAFCDDVANMLDSAPNRGFWRLLRCVWMILHGCEPYLSTKQTIIPTQTDQKLDATDGWQSQWADELARSRRENMYECRDGTEIVIPKKVG